jgi:hypothetical protein
VAFPYSAQQLQALDQPEKTRNRRPSPMIRRRDLIVSFRRYSRTHLKSIWEYGTIVLVVTSGRQTVDEITEAVK